MILVTYEQHNRAGARAGVCRKGIAERLCLSRCFSYHLVVTLLLSVVVRTGYDGGGFAILLFTFCGCLSVFTIRYL